MKIYSIFFAALFILTSVSTLKVHAQEDKWGTDSIECRRQLIYMSGAYKSGEMTRVLSYWHSIMEVCPKASPNIYIWTIKALEERIASAKTPEQKAMYVDTLLMCYDLRAKNFPERYSTAETAYDKGIALALYAPDNHEAIYNQYKIYIDLMKNDKAIEVDMLPQELQQMKFLFEKRQKTSDDILSVYEELIGVADELIKKSPDNAKAKDAKNTIDAIFISIPELSSCENLIAFFTPKMEASPTDAALLKKIVVMLERQKCQESQLFSDAAEALYKTEPSGESAQILATLFILKNDHNKASDYFKKATEATEDTEEKSKMYVQLGYMYLSDLNNSLQALSSARQALNYNPDNGSAYMIIGNAYAKLSTEASSCGEMESKSIFWAVVDAFTKAKQLDPTLANDANKYINQFSQYFPSQADAFMYGLKDGDPYTVNCAGINEKTTVRTRK